MSAEALSSARQSTLRTANLGLVLRTVCAAPEPLSRADVAAATGTTRATASRLADELVAAGLLGRVGTRRADRPRAARDPARAGLSIAALGMQVDAGLLAARVVDLRGRVVARAGRGRRLRGQRPDEHGARLRAVTTDLLAHLPDVRVVGAGLALPGIVDAAAGLLLRAPNLGWSDLRPAELLHLPLTPTLGNEADLAARTVAESAPGRPGPHRDFLYLSGQIGIGGAAVLAGQVLSGTLRLGRRDRPRVRRPRRTGLPLRLDRLPRAVRRPARPALGAPDCPSTPRPASSRRASSGATRPPGARSTPRPARWGSPSPASSTSSTSRPSSSAGTSGSWPTSCARRSQEHLRRRVLSAGWRPPTIDAAVALPAAGATGAALKVLGDVVADPARWLG